MDDLKQQLQNIGRLVAFLGTSDVKGHEERFLDTIIGETTYLLDTLYEMKRKYEK